MDVAKATQALYVESLDNYVGVVEHPANDVTSLWKTNIFGSAAFVQELTK